MKTRPCRRNLLFIALALANISLKVSSRYEVAKNKSLTQTTTVLPHKNTHHDSISRLKCHFQTNSHLLFSLFDVDPLDKPDLASERAQSRTCAVDPHPFGKGTWETPLILVPSGVVDKMGICSTPQVHEPLKKQHNWYVM